MIADLRLLIIVVGIMVNFGLCLQLKQKNIERPSLHNVSYSPQFSHNGHSSLISVFFKMLFGTFSSENMHELYICCWMLNNHATWQSINIFYLFLFLPLRCVEEFEDTKKGVIRIHQSKKDRQHNGQKKMDKQRSSKHYPEN